VVQWINNRTKFGLNITGISKKEVVGLLHQGEATASKTTVTHFATADVWDAQLASALFIRDILQHHAFEEDAEDEVHQRRHKTKHCRSKNKHQKQRNAKLKRRRRCLRRWRPRPRRH